ncbi:hypothetical protein ABZV67_42095 [Streptomyces sp. NPDC005065]|uniref:hypothetical protein n=1 Tax=Streptomyces sp. NPDC005065 TaxID=3154461 RepID=UPI0033A21B86
MDAGFALWAFRLRASFTACAALLADWDRVPVDQCCAKSKQTHVWNKNRPEDVGEGACGPAQLDTMLTEAAGRTVGCARTARFRSSSSSATSGSPARKAQKNIKDRLSMRQRAGMPR